MYRPHRDPIDMIVTVPRPTLDTLSWWLAPQVVCAGVPFRPPCPSATLTTDASALGWGAHLGDLHTQGLWSPPELSLHINVRELRAIRLACQAFQAHLRGRCVTVLTDNKMAMFYVNKQGGARSSLLCSACGTFV